MAASETASYKEFDDFKYNLRIAVMVRWAVLISWFIQFNYRPDFSDPTYIPNTMLAVALGVLNAYVHWRVFTGRRVSYQWALALSALDITAVTLGILVASGFDNNFFVLYYPALAAFAVVFNSVRLSLTGVTIAAAMYTAVSLQGENAIDFGAKEEKILFMRLVTMYALVGAVNLIARLERVKRREAVEAERDRIQENVALEKRVQDAERTMQEERIRISEEIHDGAAQSAFVISLGLDSCRNLVDKSDTELAEKIRALHQQAKQALWELRYPINLGPVFKGLDLPDALEMHLDNFSTITSIPTTFSLSGDKKTLSEITAGRLFSMAHNALTNAYRHSGASSVAVSLAFENGHVALSVEDDGSGLPDEDIDSFAGHGLKNIVRVAKELGGQAGFLTGEEGGTVVRCRVPIEEVVMRRTVV